MRNLWTNATWSSISNGNILCLQIQFLTSARIPIIDCTTMMFRHNNQILKEMNIATFDFQTQGRDRLQVKKPGNTKILQLWKVQKDTSNDSAYIKELKVEQSVIKCECSTFEESWKGRIHNWHFEGVHKLWILLPPGFRIHSSEFPWYLKMCAYLGVPNFPCESRVCQ